MQSLRAQFVIMDQYRTELITAKACYKTIFTYGFAQPCCGMAKHMVTSGMTVQVIHFLEMIKVNEEDTEDLVLCKQFINFFTEHAAIGQASGDIRSRQILRFTASFFSFEICLLQDREVLTISLARLFGASFFLGFDGADVDINSNDASRASVVVEVG